MTVQLEMGQFFFDFWYFLAKINLQFLRQTFGNIELFYYYLFLSNCCFFIRLNVSFVLFIFPNQENWESRKTEKTK